MRVNVKVLVFEIAILSCCLFPITAEAQWVQCNGTTSTTCTTANVGIGTTAPAGPFHVAANGLNAYFTSNTSATSGYSRVYVNNDVGRGPTLLSYGSAFPGTSEFGGLPYADLSLLMGFGQTGFVISSNGNAPLVFGAGPGPTEKMRIASSGYVGIGTSSPQARLHISGLSSDRVLLDNGIIISQRNVAGGVSNLLSHYSDNNVYLDNPDGPIKLRTGATLSTALTVASTGNVGIGTAAPGYPLHVASSGNGYLGSFDTTDATSGDSGRLRVQTGAPQGAVELLVVNDPAYSGGAYGFLATGKSVGTTLQYAALDHRFITNGEAMRIATSGNVGIGTTNPAQKLHVAGQYAQLEFNYTGASGPSLFLTHSRGTNAAPANVAIGDYAGGLLFGAYMGSGYATGGRVDSIVTATSTSTIDSALVFSPASIAAGTNVEAMRVTAGGTVGINNPNPSPSFKLDVNGDAHFSGTVTGGIIHANYQDVAEWVPADENLDAGTVVVLRTGQTNKVTASRDAYDTKVAGVVSERPGILLGEAGDEKAKIATTGRVRVRVDATKHAIEVGDLLVTSGERGTAMYSEPIEIAGVKIHRPGTIIGKALEPLDHGEREILVLLSLQ